MQTKNAFIGENDLSKILLISFWLVLTVSSKLKSLNIVTAMKTKEIL